MLDEIVEKLERRSFSAWQVRRTRARSHQSFLAREDVECRRSVETESCVVTVHRLRDTPQGRVLGLSSFKIGPRHLPDLDRKLDDAEAAARLVTNQPFELPEAPPHLPEVEISDPDAGLSALGSLEDRLRAALASEKGVRLSSAEFFVDRLETRLKNHKGLDLEQEETRLQTEFILLAAHSGRENEYIDRYSRRLLRDFDVEGEAAKSSQAARDAAIAGLPKTGQFPVVLAGEPLDHLFNPLVARASARLRYNKMMAIELGQDLAMGPARGDAITLWSNGLLAGALGSSRFDSYGTPSGRTCLIERNRLQRYLADKRYADYLGVPATGELANIEVEGGSARFEDLLSHEGKTLYLLTAFSAFEPNPITGAFSAEIRAGVEITPGGRRPIKGGSVSGVLQEALTDCRLARERNLRETVLIPAGIRFGQLTLAGDA